MMVKGTIAGVIDTKILEKETRCNWMPFIKYVLCLGFQDLDNEITLHLLMLRENQREKPIHSISRVHLVK